MDYEIVAVLEEEENKGGRLAEKAPMPDERPSEVRISFKTALDWLWKIGVVVLLLGKTYFVQEAMQRDIAELKARVEKLQNDSLNYSRELSELEGSHKALQSQVSSEIGQREAMMKK